MVHQLALSSMAAAVSLGAPMDVGCPACDGTGVAPEDGRGAVSAGDRGTRAWIVASMREWFEQFGEQPVAADWNPAQARAEGSAWRAIRFEETLRPWPSVTTVRKHYGSWSAGVAAAGFTPLRSGEGYRLPSTSRGRAAV